MKYFPIFSRKEKKSEKKEEIIEDSAKKTKKILFFLNGNIAFFKRTGYNGTTVV